MYVQNKALSRESICDGSLIVRSKNDLNPGMADGCTPGVFSRFSNVFVSVKFLFTFLISFLPIIPVVNQ